MFNKTDSEMSAGWDIIGSEVIRLTELGWGYDSVGNKKLAGLSYQAANIYIYLVHFAININHFMTVEGSSSDPCLTSTAADRYNLSCVDSNLPCLSSKYGADYVTAWSKLKDAFGISRNTACEPCCPGLDLMEISNTDDCKAFIIGDCGQLQLPFGEFVTNEFATNEFTEITL